MNKELEEAIERLKIMIESIKEFGIFHAVTDEDQHAIETILQALDNSIPKEKILVKIKELDKIAKKKDLIPETVKEEKLDGSYIYSQRFKADGYIAEAIIKVLQELLEEK